MSNPSNPRPKPTTAQLPAGNTRPNPSIPPNAPNTKKTPPATSARRHRISLEDDHEIYLQLMAGENKEAAEKTANQLQLEERARLLDRRSKDPAVTDPNCAPGPVDFECAERGEGGSTTGILGSGGFRGGDASGNDSGGGGGKGSRKREGR